MTLLLSVLFGPSAARAQSLESVLRPLPRTLPGMVIVQHMPEKFTAMYAQRLDGLCALNVREVRSLTQAEVGFVYLARGDADLIISKRSHGFCLMPAPSDPRFLWHPSVERMVRSALHCAN